MPQPRDPGRQKFGGRLQSIPKPAAHLSPITSFQRLRHRPNRTGPVGGPARAVDGCRGQSLGRANHDKVDRPGCRNGFHALAASSANCRTLGKEERNVAAQFGGQAGQLRADRPSRQPSLAAANAAAASLDPPPRPAAAGMRLTKKKPRPANSGPTPDQLDRTHDKIIGSLGHLMKIALFGTGCPCRTPASKTNRSVGFLPKVQRII